MKTININTVIKIVLFAGLIIAAAGGYYAYLTNQ